MSERRTIMFHFPLHATVRIVAQHDLFTVHTRRYVEEQGSSPCQEYGLMPVGDVHSVLAWHASNTLVQVAP